MERDWLSRVVFNHSSSELAHFGVRCCCGKRFDNLLEHAKHVAAILNSLLGDIEDYHGKAIGGQGK